MQETRTSQGLPTTNAPSVARLRKPLLDTEGLGFASRRLARGLTPQRIASIFDAAEQNIAEQIELAAQMEESDDHLNCTLELRRAAVLRLETHIEPGDPNDALSQQAAEAAGQILNAPWFYHTRDWLLRAIFQQWAAAEIFYEPQSVSVDTGDGEMQRALLMPVGFRAVEPQRWHFDQDGNPQLYLSRSGAGETVEPIAGKFIVHSYSAVYGQPSKYAKVRAIAKLWYLGQLDMTGWGEMVDSWASPFVVFQYSEGMSEADVQRAIDYFLTLASRRAAAVPQNVNVTLHPVPDQSPHEKFQDFIRRAESRFILGQDSSQTAIEGQKTGATLQGDVRDDIRDMDAQLLDASINETLLAPWCAWNFGPGVAAPRISHRIREEKDPEQLGRTLSVAQTLGMVVPSEWAYQSLGIPMPDGVAGVLFGGRDSGIQGLRDSVNQESPNPSIPQSPNPSSTERAPLNGVQISAALDVLSKLANKSISAVAAEAMLEALGFAPEQAARMVNAQNVKVADVSADDIAFMRQLLLTWIQDGTVSDVVYNATDILDLLARLGIKVEPGYQPPWIPVQTPDGGTVTGDVIKDNQGDIVGGVEDPVTASAPQPPARFEAGSNGDPGPLDDLLKRVRSLAAGAKSFDEFRAALPTIVGQDAALEKELLTATFGAYCIGRIEAADELAKLEGRTIALAAANLELASDGRPLDRQRFSQAIDQFAQRSDLVTKPQFLKLEGEARAKAWTVARVTELDVLKDLHDAVGQAIEGGQTWREFKDSLNTIMENRGWAGLTPWHSRLVFDQNLLMAHSAGRTTQARDSGANHWRKLPTDSITPREEHAQWDGKVFSFDQMTPPPWGFGCKCNWEPVFDDEIDAADLATDQFSAPDRPPLSGEFRWNASDYFRPMELRKGDYPEQFWGLIDKIAADHNALLKVRDE